MKQGKKVAAVFCAAVMTVGVVALSACAEADDTDIGVVEGNFGTVATEEQLGTALDSITESAPFGDTEAADWAYGFNFKANATATVDAFDVDNNGNFVPVTTSADLGIDYNLSLSKTTANELGLDVKGSGAVALNGKSGEEELSYSAEVYNDIENAYVKLTANEETLKLKVSYETIFDMIGSALPLALAEADETDAPDDTTDVTIDGVAFDPSEMLGMLAAMGFQVYIDDSDGLKIKVSATEDTVGTILEQAGVSAEAVKFNEFVFNIYFSFDAQGNFEKFGAQINVNLEVAVVPATATTEAQSVKVSVKCGAALVPYSGTVTLPDDLNTYHSMDALPF